MNNVLTTPPPLANKVDLQHFADKYFQFDIVSY